MNLAQVRLATIQDLPQYNEHLKRHGLENGQGGDLFAPYEEPRERPFDTLKKEKEEKWQRPITEIDWERCWIITDGSMIYGELKLAHAIGLKTSLHRALLMMGIERSHRARGFGSALMQTAINWAQTQPSLHWIQLNVFEHNDQAKKLYQRFGFQEVGTNQDLFRIHNQSINDIEMSLRIRVSP